MCCFQKIVEAGPLGRERSSGVAHEGDRPRHVEGGPGSDAIAKMAGENAGIVGEVACKVTVWPAPAVFECLREIPVVHGAPGPDAGGQEGVDETAVVVESLHVRRADTGWLNARPGDGKPLALLVETLG